MLGEVDAGRDGTGAHEADEVGSKTDADLEQALATSSLEFGKPVDVGIELVACALDLREELRRSLCGRRMLGAAGLLFPEIADSLLLIYCGRRRGHRFGLY